MLTVFQQTVFEQEGAGRDGTANDAQPQLHNGCSPSGTGSRRLSTDASGMQTGPPDLFGRLQATQATPSLWAVHRASAMQSRLPLATRSPNTISGREQRAGTGQMPSGCWDGRGVCPGALDTVGFSHPLYTMSREQARDKSPVPTPVKDTVRKNLFGA